MRTTREVLATVPGSRLRSPVKPALVLLLALCLGIVPTLVAQAPDARPAVRNLAGEVLRNPSIIAFDGAAFDVAHEGGVAKVPWERMPEAWRRGYAYDPGAPARAAEARARAKGAPRSAEAEPEVIVAGKSLGLNQDRQLWIVLPMRLDVRMPNGSPPGEAELRRLPSLVVPQGSQIAVIPAAEVPPGWEKDQFVLVKARLIRRAPLPNDPATMVNYVRGVTPWSDPQVTIKPSQPPRPEVGR